MSRLAKHDAHSTHAGESCDRPFVYPEFGIQEGTRWRVFVRCGSCGWSGERIFDDKALEEFERELDHDHAELKRDLQQLTEQNMRDYCELFVAALNADAVLPEDF
jgi:hypothetical protein